MRAAGADATDGPLLPDADAGAGDGPGRQPVRPRGHGQDGVGEDAGVAAGPLLPGVQLRRVLRLPGHGPHLPRTVPGGRVGLLRRVQPAGGAHPVGGVAADLDHPDGPAPPAEGDPPAGHARGAAPERGHLRDDEPGLRGPLEPAGQPEATVPQHRDDPAGLGAHRAGDALLAGLPLVGDAGGQAGASLLAVPRPAVRAAALRLRASRAEVGGDERGQPEAPQAGGGREGAAGHGRGAAGGVRARRAAQQRVRHSGAEAGGGGHSPAAVAAGQRVHGRRHQGDRGDAAARDDPRGVSRAQAGADGGLRGEGAAAVPGAADPPRHHDGGALGKRQVLRDPLPAGGTGARGRAAGRDLHDRPEGDHEGPAVRVAGHDDQRVDRRHLHAHHPADLQRRARRVGAPPLDRVRRRRGPRVGGEPEQRAGRQPAADAAHGRPPVVAGQRAHPVRGGEPEVRHARLRVALRHRVAVAGHRRHGGSAAAHAAVPARGPGGERPGQGAAAGAAESRGGRDGAVLRRALPAGAEHRLVAGAHAHHGDHGHAAGGRLRGPAAPARAGRGGLQHGTHGDAHGRRALLGLRRQPAGGGGTVGLRRLAGGR